MTAPISPTPRTVLLAAIDDSPAAARVVAQAASLARSMPGSELHLAYVAGSSGLDAHRAYLDERGREAQVASDATVVGHLFREGPPANVIVQLAASLDADLVLVGTRDRHGVDRWVMGSVAAKVVARAACPVLVVRPKDHHAAHAPEIEPPCPDCLIAQRASHGTAIWCARHAEHHPRAHVHYAIPEGFGSGSSLIQS